MHAGATGARSQGSPVLDRYIARRLGAASFDALTVYRRGSIAIDRSGLCAATPSSEQNNLTSAEQVYRPPSSGFPDRPGTPAGALVPPKP
jgi:hypothetical protein